MESGKLNRHSYYDIIDKERLSVKNGCFSDDFRLYCQLSLLQKNELRPVIKYGAIACHVVPLHVNLALATPDKLIEWPREQKEQNQVSKGRYFVYYLTQCCFTFFPILLSIILLFQLTETSMTSGLNMALPKSQIQVVGFVLCLIVPVSVAIGWLFLKIWIFLAKPGMTPSEIRRFIQRGIGIKA